MKLNFKWKTNTARFQTGESLFLGRILVGNYGWNATRSQSEPKDDTKNWVGQTTLPQATKAFYEEDPDKVRAKIEHQVTAWFSEALMLKEKL